MLIGCGIFFVFWCSRFMLVSRFGICVSVGSFLKLLVSFVMVLKLFLMLKLLCRYVFFRVRFIGSCSICLSVCLVFNVSCVWVGVWFVGSIVLFYSLRLNLCLVGSRVLSSCRVVVCICLVEGEGCVCCVVRVRVFRLVVLRFV